MKLKCYNILSTFGSLYNHNNIPSVLFSAMLGITPLFFRIKEFDDTINESQLDILQIRKLCFAGICHYIFFMIYKLSNLVKFKIFSY